MLDLFSRQAYHMELVLEPIPESAPPIFLQDWLDPLVAMIDAEKAVYLTGKKTKAMRARKCMVDYENKILFLLINFADTNVSDPAFEKLETGELRIEPKLDGEGVAISTFMAIDLNPVSDRFPVYRALLEDVPGIGRSKISPFLTYLARKCDVRSYWEDDEGKQKSSRPSFSIKGAMSETLENDLANGELSFIELVRYKANAGFDEQGVLEEEKSILRIKVKRVPDGDRLNLLNRVKKKANAKGFVDMRVGYNSATRNSKTVEFGTAREDVADVLTIKNSTVKLDAARRQCEDELRDDVIEKLTLLTLQRRIEEA